MGQQRGDHNRGMDKIWTMGPARGRAKEGICAHSVDFVGIVERSGYH